MFLVTCSQSHVRSHMFARQLQMQTTQTNPLSLQVHRPAGRPLSLACCSYATNQLTASASTHIRCATCRSMLSHRRRHHRQSNRLNPQLSLHRAMPCILPEVLYQTLPSLPVQTRIQSFNTQAKLCITSRSNQTSWRSAYKGASTKLSNSMPRVVSFSLCLMRTDRVLTFSF